MQSTVDHCLCTKHSIILILYTDNTVLISPSKPKIKHKIKSLQEEYFLTNEGELKDYLGIRFEKVEVGIHLFQPYMIDKILQTVRLDPASTSNKVYSKDILALVKLLDSDLGGKGQKQHWNYCKLVGILKYVQNMSLDISVAT